MNRIKRPRRVLAATLLALASSIGYAEEVFLDRVVAIVDNNVVMETELNSLLQRVIQNVQANNGALPPEEELKRQVLDQLILERLQLNFAEDRNIRISDAEINHRLGQIAASQNMTLDQLVEATHQQGGSLSELRREIHNRLVIEFIEERVIKRNIPLTLQEIELFLDSEEAQIWKSPELQLGHIQISLSAGASKLEEQNASIKAKKLIEKLNEGTDFRQLAISNSSGPSALEGGDMGWRRAVSLPPQLANGIKDLQPGQVSEPIRNNAGLHIFKVYDRRGGEQAMMLQQYNVRHILLKPNAIRDEEACYNQLMEIRQRIADGEEFAALAKEFSEDPGSKQDGGGLGWHTEEERNLVPEFLQMMTSVEIGEVSYPFRSELGIDPKTQLDRGPGWHILEVTERREKDFGENVTMNKASQFLVNRKFEEERALWLQDLRSHSYIEKKL